jgi:hypothetical protein
MPGSVSWPGRCSSSSRIALRVVLDEQDPGHAGAIRTGQAVDMISERLASARPRRKKIGHGPDHHPGRGNRAVNEQAAAVENR